MTDRDEGALPRHGRGPGARGRASRLARGAGLIAVGLVMGLTAGLIVGGRAAPLDPATGVAGGAPGPTPDAAAAPDPAAKGGGGDYLLIDRAALRRLPTSGEAWDRIVAAATADWPDPDLDDRSTAALPHALAAALVAARTDDAGARERVLDALRELREAPAPDDLLSVARQLGGWAIAADLVGAKDPELLDWFADLRHARIGDHPRWQTLYATAGDSANNYGTFSLASLIAVDRLLGDERELRRDWRIFVGYGRPFGWPFRKTHDWEAPYSCVEDVPERPDTLPIAINPPGCGDEGSLDGMPVEDASREGDPPDPHARYVNEAMQGYVVQALLLARAGFDAWGVNDAQVRRVAEYQVRWSIWNPHRTGQYVAWIVNAAYGTDFPAEPDTTGGRMLAWTEWLFP